MFIFTIFSPQDDMRGQKEEDDGYDSDAADSSFDLDNCQDEDGDVANEIRHNAYRDGVQQGAVNDQGDDQGEVSASSAESELRDATIKLLRLLANLSIEGVVGPELARNNETFDVRTDATSLFSLRH